MLPKKILLAEDDADDVSLFTGFLEHREDIVIMPVAENGVALIESLEKLAVPTDLPDLIILDQNMPKRNGLQTLQMLRASERFRHIPVMIYSTYLDPLLVKTSLENGARLVLPKPDSRAGYERMIDTALEAL